MKTFTLPNGDTVSIIDKLTAIYVYNEIYEDKVYLYGGISVTDGDVILDIGANIGIFSRFIATQANNLKIYGFEPIAPIFQALEENTKNLPAEVKNFNIGLGDKNETLEITYYPKCSGDSAIVPFVWEKKLDLYVKNYKEAICVDVPIAKLVPKRMRRRVVEAGLKKVYKGERLSCKIHPLSEIIREYKIECIDLMKIDAENYEKQVLAGINEEDWKKIRQIAMEVHTHIEGGDNLMNEIIELLKNKGFSNIYEGEESRETIMGVYMLYAKKEKEI